MKEDLSDKVFLALIFKDIRVILGMTKQEFIHFWYLNIKILDISALFSLHRFKDAEIINLINILATFLLIMPIIHILLGRLLKGIILLEDLVILLIILRKLKILVVIEIC